MGPSIVQHSGHKCYAIGSFQVFQKCLNLREVVMTKGVYFSLS